MLILCIVYSLPIVTIVAQDHGDGEEITAHAQNHGIQGDHDTMISLQL